MSRKSNVCRVPTSLVASAIIGQFIGIVLSCIFARSEVEMMIWFFVPFLLSMGIAVWLEARQILFRKKTFEQFQTTTSDFFKLTKRGKRYTHQNALSPSDLKTMFPSSHFRIEQLREDLEIFKSASEFLYRYGNPEQACRVFNEYSSHDRLCSLSLALLEQDSDLHNVATYLMKLILKREFTLSELLEQIPPQIRIYIEKITAKQVSNIDRDRILAELKTAMDCRGDLPFEEAYWVLILEKQPPHWIKAMDDNGQIPTQVMHYSESNEDRLRLIVAMNSAQIILHVHNHPIYPISSPLQSSEGDRHFAYTWENKRKELKGKMLFFIVQSQTFLQYSVFKEDRLQADW
jgi:hypothetical protein